MLTSLNFDCRKQGVRKCTAWDWCDPELDNGWYKAHLYEMYKTLTPYERVQVLDEVTSQEKLVVLVVEMEQLKVQMKKSQKYCLILKSFVILFVLGWFLF